MEEGEIRSRACEGREGRVGARRAQDGCKSQNTASHL